MLKFWKINFCFEKHGLHSYRGARRVPSIFELVSLIFVLNIKTQLLVHFQESSILSYTIQIPRRGFFFSLSLFFFLFRASPATYGGSQARGRIGAAAANLHHSHSNTGSGHICNLHHSSWQHWVLNPLSEARDRTCILMDTMQVCYHWAITGNPTPTQRVFPMPLNSQTS